MSADLARAGVLWHRAKDREREAMRVLREMIERDHAAGMPETEIARTAGVDRMTVRRALGKL